MEHLPKGKYYVTIKGRETLVEELEKLQGQRGELSENIRVARGFGDLSENFEYHAAKQHQGMVESRIRQLSIIVPELHVVNPDDVPTDRVCFGSVVTLLDEEEGDEWDVTVVGPLEANPDEEKISYQAPLGASLIGKRVGEKAEVKLPDHSRYYVVQAIRAYEP